jgi:hypothetical protein
MIQRRRESQYGFGKHRITVLTSEARRESGGTVVRVITFNVAKQLHLRLQRFPGRTRLPFS